MVPFPVRIRYPGVGLTPGVAATYSALRASRSPCYEKNSARVRTDFSN
jgi:hypothetical protein